MAPAEADPLDERRVDPRDLQPVPFRFALPTGRLTMRPFNQMAPGLARSRIYWTYGSSPKGALYSCVDDPPSSGWSTVLVVGDHDGPLRVLCPFTLRAYSIRPDSHERSSMQGQIDAKSDAELLAYYRDLLPRKWAEVARHGEGKPDFKLAEQVCSILGVRPPTPEEIERVRPAYAPPPKARAPEKPAAKPTSAFKPVKRAGRKGEVLAAILEGKTSADALTSQFGITRSNLLSQLFLLRKDHGIGYKASGDRLVLELPEGVSDPFAP